MTSELHASNSQGRCQCELRNWLATCKRELLHNTLTSRGENHPFRVTILQAAASVLHPIAIIFDNPGSSKEQRLSTLLRFNIISSSTFFDMSRSSLIQASRVAARALRSSGSSRMAIRTIPSVSHAAMSCRQIPSIQRCLSSSTTFRKGIMPDTETPAKEAPASPELSYGVVELSESEYHDIADEYLDGVLTEFEALQDSREDIDIEFSVRSPPLNRRPLLIHHEYLSFANRLLARNSLES